MLRECKVSIRSAVHTSSSAFVIGGERFIELT